MTTRPSVHNIPGEGPTAPVPTPPNESSPPQPFEDPFDEPFEDPRQRGSFLADLTGLLLVAVGGTLVGLGVGFWSGARLVALLEVRTEALVLARDVTAYDSMARLMTGFGGIFLPIAGLALGLVLVLVGVVLASRRGERTGKVLVRGAIGLLIGAALAAVTIVFAGGTDLTVAAMTAARVGEARILAATLWPRVLYFVFFGATVGWAMGAVLASHWLRRILLVVPAAGLAVLASVMALSARPGMIDLPANAPQLDTGDGADEMPIYVIGGSSKAMPVTLGLSMFTSSVAKGPPLRVTRRNVGRAQKAVEVLPVLHPRSAAAEQLLVAGALSDLNPEGAVEHLWNAFGRRGNGLDGMLLATTLGRLAPSETASRYLAAVTDPSKVHVGPAAAKRLCPLALSTGNGKAAKQLRCPGRPEKVKTGTVKAVLSFKGRVLKRTPVGLIAEPAGVGAEWVKQGQVSAASLALVSGTRTGPDGEVTFTAIPAGTYLLAVAPPRRRGTSKVLALEEEVRIEVPPAGGLVDLGEIVAGGRPPGKGGPRRGPAVTAGRAAGMPSIHHPDAALDSSAEEQVDEAAPQGDRAAPTPATDRPSPPLPPAARRLVSKIRPAGRNRVVVPRGFARELLDADRSAIHPSATVRPVSGRSGRGLELAGIRDNGVAVALGFAEGDVVESINGRQTRQPNDLVALVDHLEGERRVTVRIRRDGRPLTLRIDIDR